MAERTAEIDVAGAPDDVWKLVGDFGGIADWMPGMESCRLEGDRRILDTMGMTITEQLVDRNDSSRAITYAIVDGVPVESHQATITVTPSGAGSHVTWVVAAAPDEMADLMQSVYQQSLEALKAHVEA
jgi:mxaD protein